MIECPNCGNTSLLFLEEENVWLCRFCGHKFEFPPKEEKKSKEIVKEKSK